VPANLHIRPPEATDRPAWEDLWRAYLAFYGTERPPEVYDWTWEQIQTGRTNMYALLACDENKPIALVHFLYHHSFWEPEPRCYLNDLFTLPGARGSGAGKALINAVYDHAKGQGSAGVYWLTAEDNTTARALYDQVAQKTPFIKYMEPK